MKNLLIYESLLLHKYTIFSETMRLLFQLNKKAKHSIETFLQNGGKILKNHSVNRLFFSRFRGYIHQSRRFATSYHKDKLSGTSDSNIEK